MWSIVWLTLGPRVLTGWQLEDSCGASVAFPHPVGPALRSFLLRKLFAHVGSPLRELDTKMNAWPANLTYPSIQTSSSIPGD